MKWNTILRRRREPPKPAVTVENSYEEIRAAMDAKKINYAYGFGLISEKNRRAQLARNKST